MAAGYAIYHSAASGQWGVVEIPETWTREEALPPRSLADRWFDALDQARAELTRRLDDLPAPRAGAQRP